MKIKNAATFTALTFAMIMCATPITASGNKDMDSPTTEHEESVLHVVDRPFGFGEGGGIGAGIRPSGFEEIDESIITGEAKEKSYVAAQMTSLTGTLKVSGNKGKRKFSFNCDDGKTFALNIQGPDAETVAALKDKKLKVSGVFYGTDFLVFDVAKAE